MDDIRWSDLSAEELERRRQQSIAAFDALKQEEWDAAYQKRLDAIYWKGGRCCAGCDHFNWTGGGSGFCEAAGIVSGDDVMRSAGISWSSRQFEPGFPHTREDHYCGKFKDEFDWSSLPLDYLESVGAARDGRLKPKPDWVRRNG